MLKHREPQLGFFVQIEPRVGFTVAEANHLDRGLQDYAEAHDLDLGDEKLVLIVSADDRSLTATDQVNFMDWLMSQPGISVVRVSTLTVKLEKTDAQSVWQAGVAHVSVGDLGAIGLSVLYRARRITADLYLQILGGFVRPTIVH
jgi:hypothetical protein